MALFLVDGGDVRKETKDNPNVLTAPITSEVLELVLNDFISEGFEEATSRIWAARLHGLSEHQRQTLLHSGRHWQAFWIQWGVDQTVSSREHHPSYTRLRHKDDFYVVFKIDGRPHTVMIGQNSFEFDGVVFLYNSTQNTTHRAGLHLLPIKKPEIGPSQFRALIYIQTSGLLVTLTDWIEGRLRKLLARL